MDAEKSHKEFQTDRNNLSDDDMIYVYVNIYIYGICIYIYIYIHIYLIIKNYINANKY